jgi:prepilin-type N-terminal cleavage/methylation domain-containing protein
MSLFKRSACSRQKGFTLSELLVSLSVLGLIAALSIPSILAGVEKNQLKARYKETFNVISNVMQTGLASGELTTTGDIAYLSKNMNAEKVCTNAGAEGCWGGSDTVANKSNTPGILLHSGASITDIENNTSGADRYFIDVNGASEPNIRCEDQFPVVVSVLENSNFEGRTLRLGEVKQSSTENGYGVSSGLWGIS